MNIIDIPTQILLTIFVYMNHSLRCTLKVNIITQTNEKTIYDKLIFFAKLSSQKSEKNLS